MNFTIVNFRRNPSSILSGILLFISKMLGAWVHRSHLDRKRINTGYFPDRVTDLFLVLKARCFLTVLLVTDRAHWGAGRGEQVARCRTRRRIRRKKLDSWAWRKRSRNSCSKKSAMQPGRKWPLLRVSLFLIFFSRKKYSAGYCCVIQPAFVI